MKPPFELIVGQLSSERLQDEFAQRLSAPTRTLPKLAMNILWNIFDLKIRHYMKIACSQACHTKSYRPVASADAHRTHGGWAYLGSISPG